MYFFSGIQTASQVTSQTESNNIQFQQQINSTGNVSCGLRLQSKQLLSVSAAASGLDCIGKQRRQRDFL